MADPKPAPAPAPAPEPAAETGPTPAERLRAFENEKLGPDAPRHAGKIEMGHGSPFKNLSDEDKAQYAALEEVVAADAAVSTAHADLSAATVRLADAEQKLAEAETKAAEAQEARDKADAERAAWDKAQADKATAKSKPAVEPQPAPAAAG